MLIQSIISFTFIFSSSHILPDKLIKLENEQKISVIVHMKDQLDISNITGNIPQSELTSLLKE